MADARQTLTPLLEMDSGETVLLLIDLAGGRRRLGGSALAQVYGQLGNDPPDLDDPDLLAGFFAFVQQQHRELQILAYHDVADGGLFTTLAEMAFASRCGLDVTLDEIAAEPLPALFAEVGRRAPGARQRRRRIGPCGARRGLSAAIIGTPIAGDRIRIMRHGALVIDEARIDLHRAWSSTTRALQVMRDHPSRPNRNMRASSMRMIWDLAAIDVRSERRHRRAVHRNGRPSRVAILREQEVNGQVEMAAAFDRAGFDAHDVHMTDLAAGGARSPNSKGSRPAAGFLRRRSWRRRGWAKSILFAPSCATTLPHSSRVRTFSRSACATDAR